MKITEISESVKISVSALVANPMRSFLASLGVVVGISLVILMGWLISGLDKAMQDTFETIGDDMIFVDKYDWSGGESWEETRNRKDINQSHIDMFSELNTQAQLVIPNINKWGSKITYKQNGYEVSAVGTTSENQYTPAGQLLKGRYFSKFEEKIGASVVVIGYDIYKSMAKSIPEPMGKTVKMNGKPLTVIGVIKKRGTFLFNFIDRQVFYPVKTFESIFGKNAGTMSIGVKAGSKERMDKVRDETIGNMRVVRNLKPWQKDDFSINETKAFERSIAEIRMGVWGVGIGMTMLAFIVGIIGIMNIMFVSVSERTKEIGIRKAIGAKRSSILLQFVTEAIILCLVGALVALVFCSALAYAAGTYLPQHSPSLSFLLPTLPTNLIIIATVVSFVVGIVAGISPAIRASKLDPVEALRYE